MISTGLNFLIAKYLRSLKNQTLVDKFVDTLQQDNLLPCTTNWNGTEQQTSFEQLDQQYSHLKDDHLAALLSNLMCHVEQGIDKRFGSLTTFLLQNDPTCFLRNAKDEKQSSKYNIFAMAYNPCQTVLQPKTRNIKTLTKEREYFGRTLSAKLPSTDMYKRMNMRLKVIAHKASVYCVVFDRTGNYALSGADDLLIKMWCVKTGRLLASYRGHSKEICDIDISFENTLLASASLDKKVRIWSLKTTETITVLHGHSQTVNMTRFSPFCKTDDRWLASVGNDGNICFWRYLVITNDFEPRPIKFVEKSRAGAQMLCLAFSSGGYFLAAGSSDFVIRVYSFHTYIPMKICELDSHNNIVETICYSHMNNSFISGSKDGTARIWRYEEQSWRAIILNFNKELLKRESGEYNCNNTQKIIPVTIVAWSCNDKKVSTAYENGLIKVWDSLNGMLLNELKKHDKIIFVLECHPTNERLMCSAGHDGLLIIWDICDGRLIKQFLNDQYVDIPCSIPYSDAKWSPHCDMIITTDLCGQVCFFGLGNDTSYNQTQIEQFFHNDLRPLLRDPNEKVLDQHFQLPPHLLPPPFLTDDHGHPYSNEIQRCVPGRENNSSAENTANIVNNEYLEDILIVEPSTFPETKSTFARRALETTDVSSFGLTKRQTYVYHRRLIPKLSEAEREFNENIRQVRFDNERSNYELEFNKKSQNSEYSQVPYVKKRTTRNFVRLRQEELMKKVPHNEIVAINRLTTRALYDSDKDDKTDVSDEQYIPNSTTNIGEISDDDSVSTVSTDDDLASVPNRISTRGSQKRLQRHRTLAVEDDEEEDNEEERQHEHHNHSADEKAEHIKQTHRRRHKLKRKKKRREQCKQRKEELEKSSVDLNNTDTSRFIPPEWLSNTRPKRAPYVPQVGDIVMYFLQGHELYVNDVKDKNIYEIDDQTLPWNKCSLLKSVECGQIVGYAVEVLPPRLISVRIQLLDSDTLEETARRINVKFHDIDGIADFLVLKQYYDQAMKQKWKIDDRCRCYIDDIWWYGTILKEEPFDSRHENSPFQCYVIKWDSGEEERLSSWDLEPITDLRPTTSSSQTALPILYTPISNEWPDDGQEIECKRLSFGIETIMQVDEAKDFISPVDFNVYKFYHIVIPYPIDLKTIKDRIDNGYYRRENAVKWDVKKIEENAKAFNEKGSLIIDQATIVTKVILKYIDNNQCNDIMEIYRHVVNNEKISQRTLTPSESQQLFTHDNEGWFDDCQTVLDDVYAQTDSDLFRHPINSDEYPDYNETIHKPICFDEIQEKLNQHSYRHTREFIADCRLIFQNAITYSDPDMINLARRLEPWFETRVDVLQRQRRTVSQLASNSGSQDHTSRRRQQRFSHSENNIYTTGDGGSRFNRRAQFSSHSNGTAGITQSNSTSTAPETTTFITTDRRHSHYHRVIESRPKTNSTSILTTSANFSFIPPMATTINGNRRQYNDSSSNSDTDEYEVKKKQDISLTTFLEHNDDGSSRQRLRKRNDNTWQSRTRYGGRPVISYAQNRDEEDGDNEDEKQSFTKKEASLSRSVSPLSTSGDEASNNKRKRMERYNGNHSRTQDNELSDNEQNENVKIEPLTTIKDEETTNVIENHQVSNNRQESDGDENGIREEEIDQNDDDDREYVPENQKSTDEDDQRSISKDEDDNDSDWEESATVTKKRSRKITKSSTKRPTTSSGKRKRPLYRTRTHSSSSEESDSKNRILVKNNGQHRSTSKRIKTRQILYDDDEMTDEENDSQEPIKSSRGRTIKKRFG